MAQILMKSNDDSDFPVYPADEKKKKGSDMSGLLDRKKKRMEEEARTRAKMSEDLASSIEEMLVVTDQAYNTTSEMLSSGEQFSRDAEKASALAEKSMDIATNLDKLAHKTMEAGEEVVHEIGVLKQILDQYTEKVNSAIVGITNSATVNREVVKSQESLIRKGDEIGHIVQSVVGIADQTNLLALNAAIEAARAGEHGRGFAVVADEVRNLAANAETAAREISDVVDAIQNDIKSISGEVASIGESAELLADEIKKVAEMGKEVQLRADEMKRAAEEYTNGAKVQIMDIADYLQAAEQIASSAEQTASSATQLVNSLKEQGEALNEIQGAVNMLSSVAEYIKEGQASSDESSEVSSASEELAATVQETHSSTQQISIAIQEIRVGAEQSVSAVERCEQLSLKTQESSNHALEGANRIASLIRDRISTFKEDFSFMEGVFKNAQRIASMNVESAKKLKFLGRKAKQIDKIVETIVNIAIQTNLLALNGAIEAARAGEYGKGFSVVAVDVKNLASESSISADKIKDLARNLQVQISSVGQSVEKAGKQASQEYERGQEIIETMNDIYAIYEKVLARASIVIGNGEKQLEFNERGIESTGETKMQAEKTMSGAITANAAAEMQVSIIENMAEIVEKIARFAVEMESL